ncbi:MAG: hypothetical protein ACKVS6_14440 [Planctomycetota bacterium]
MGFIETTRPGSTGFFLFPVDTENPQSRIPHDYTRSYSLAPFERTVDARTFAQLKQRVGSGKLSVVGLWPDEAVVKKYDFIVGGETCFFLNKQQLLAHGTIVHADRSRQLSDALFGKGSPGTHELLVLLAGVEPLNMPLDKFYAAIGRKSKASIKAFTTLSSEAVQNIADRYGSIFSFIEAAKAPI